MMLALLLLSLGTAGCVRYYKTKDVRSSFSKGARRFDRALGKVRIDLKKKRVRCAARAGSAEQASLLNTMARHFGELQGVRARLVDLRRRFDKLSRGRSRIRSDQPQWEAVQGIRDELKALGERSQSIGKDYSKASNKLTRLLGRRR